MMSHDKKYDVKIITILPPELKRTRQSTNHFTFIQPASQSVLMPNATATKVEAESTSNMQNTSQTTTLENNKEEEIIEEIAQTPDDKKNQTQTTSQTTAPTTSDATIPKPIAPVIVNPSNPISSDAEIVIENETESPKPTGKT